MRISDWSSDVCSSDLQRWHHQQQCDRRYACSRAAHDPALRCGRRSACRAETVELERPGPVGLTSTVLQSPSFMPAILFFRCPELCDRSDPRSEEHTSELQSLMRSSYDVFCLKKNKHEKHQR